MPYFADFLASYTQIKFSVKIPRFIPVLSKMEHIK